MSFELTHELREQLIKIEGHEALNKLEERESAIYQAVNLARYCGYNAGYRAVGDKSVPVPEWAGDVVAYIGLPNGEVSYFLKKADATWSGYTRKEKLARISDYLSNSYPPITTPKGSSFDERA